MLCCTAVHVHQIWYCKSLCKRLTRVERHTHVLGRHVTVENCLALDCSANARGMWMCHHAVLRDRIASTSVPACLPLHLCFITFSITAVLAITRCRSIRPAHHSRACSCRLHTVGQLTKKNPSISFVPPNEISNLCVDPQQTCHAN